MASSELISVVMPCHNAGVFIEDAVQCVITQTYSPIELIVIDDGSSDRSLKQVQQFADRYPERVRALSQDQRGPYPARNLGLEHAGGKYVAFLDADDWWSPQTLEKLRHALLTYHADLAYCGWQNVGDGVSSPPYIPPAYEEDDVVAHFLRTCPWPIHAALVRRELVDRLGGFSTRRYSSMDYDFWLRALALTRRIKRVPEVLAYYRWHNKGQVSAVKWRQVLDALDAQRQFIGNNRALVAHLSPNRLKDLTEGQVLRQAYRALWNRDLVSAQKLFRRVAANGGYGTKDVRYVLSAFLPMPLYRTLARFADRRRA